ncbi:extracellular solute-binding protein [Lactococcus lactis]|uniref:Arabinogalactan oligomer/maltooligosaccharide transport system substrate-binding protein n=1 Tax=Lactococcus lactis TaxID=1358 RepID=A0AAP3Z148_9LACT|nr:extracellular solute-binding protein [Lactococcus lactis]MCT3092238.1 extracellular solute-binding protein [Lactococcus lactis]MCW2280297.1 arabinogalactan oligomer/maltooligosaccharide transport system substrate-binding protein [Lactococcus lactis]MDG4968204.1 extracellular solute-binding protein [Lactococcus lactis]MDG4976436.1 extracellular solute-binding protein [Lactococcus lactis]MDG5102240.1 extracellular solute-binding protein [Lactococcus lactis]
MKSWKKVALGGASVLALATLAACGSSASSNKSSSSSSSNNVKGNVTLWVDPANVDSYKTLVTGFEKKYPDVKVKVNQSPTGSANAKTDVGKDPAKAADVFKVPNDQLGAMAEAGYINPLSPDATKWVDKNDISVAGEAVSWKGKYYAYPQDQQSNIIFYNKAKFSEAPTSWTQFTQDKAIGTDFTNSYNWYPAFLSNGTVLFGKDGETLDGTDVAGDAGLQVLNWFAKQKSNTGVVQSGQALLADLKSGKTAAVLDGPWDASNVKKILGDNYGVTTLPTIDFGSGEKKMQAFSGVGTLAVNSASKNQVAASSLAQYLSNADSQKELYKDNNAIPVAKSLQTDSDITTDPAAQAVIKQVPEDTLMPKMPEMATFWNLAAPLINNTYLGKTPASQYDSQLKTFQDSISKATK